MKRVPLLVAGALALAFAACEKHSASELALIEPHHGSHAEHASVKHEGQKDAESVEPADAKSPKDAHEQRESPRFFPEQRR